jgi:hypothetical protein
MNVKANSTEMIKYEEEERVKRLNRTEFRLGEVSF